MNDQINLKSSLPRNASRRTKEEGLSAALLQKLRENPRKLDKILSSTGSNQKKARLYKKANKIYSVYMCVLSIYDDDACNVIFPPNTKSPTNETKTTLATNEKSNAITTIRNLTPENLQKIRNLNENSYLPLTQILQTQTLSHNPNEQTTSNRRIRKRKRNRKAKKPYTVIQTNTANKTQNQSWQASLIPQLISLLCENFPTTAWMPQYLLLHTSPSQETFTYQIQHLTISYKILTKIPRHLNHIQGIVAQILQLIILTTHEQVSLHTTVRQHTKYNRCIQLIISFLENKRTSLTRRRSMRWPHYTSS